MGIEKVGYRKLYEAVNCCIDGADELSFEIKFGDYAINVYIGFKPLSGIYQFKNKAQYVFKTEDLDLNLSFWPDATLSPYSKKLFTEILCYKEIQVPDELSIQFHQENPQEPTLMAKAAILDIANAEMKRFKQYIDIVAGVIGLKAHPQYVRTCINENPCIFKDTWQIGPISSAPFEIVNQPTISDIGKIRLSNLLTNINSLDLKLQKIAPVALGWLWQGWNEQNPISKFMAFFTALEVSCKAVTELKSEEIERRNKNNEAIEALIRTSEANHKKDMLNHFAKLKQNQALSLTDCFIAIAEESGLNGWQADIEAFKKFYRKRNDLIHRGSSEILLILDVSKDEVRRLEDIVERYLSLLFFGNDSVYLNPGNRHSTSQ